MQKLQNLQKCKIQNFYHAKITKTYSNAKLLNF